MKPPFLRTAYNYDTNKASDESGIECTEPTLTKQAFAEECDINTIVDRFMKTGAMPENVRMPTYGDFTGVSDFHSAMNAIALANEAFDEMPAKVRAKFHNDPAEFVDFCSDPKNLKEAGELGLITPEALERLNKPAQQEKTPPAATPPASSPPKGEDKKGDTKGVT